MPLDHYVSQVHLSHFSSPELRGDLMYAIRKSDLKAFPCRPKDVCRIENGSSNDYLLHDRVIEQFLKEIEPKYNQALATLRQGKIDHTAAFVVAGFAAYITTCSPTAMRIGTGPLKASLTATARILERHGHFEAPPPELGGTSLMDLIDKGKLHFEVDPKYPQAIGIGNVVKMAAKWGNSAWEILFNEFPKDTPFFTSDFPVSIESTRDPRVVNRLIPLAPDIALRILPDLKAPDDPQLTFANLRTRFRRASHQEIRSINQATVQCAESLVFYAHEQPWIAAFVKRHRGFKIDCITQDMKLPEGSLLMSSQRIVPC
jgi:hypothetical protein